jgi:hypothetical protein
MASALFPHYRPALRKSAARSHASARLAAEFAALSLLLSVPLIALAVWAGHRGFAAPSLQWVVHRGQVAVSGYQLTRLDYVYPPVPVLLSRILPGGTISLAICTCLLSGVLAASLLMHFGLRKALVVLLPLAGVPAMWYASSEALPQVFSILFLAVALFGFLRFFTYGETAGGFIAGFALAAAYSSDPSALVYAVVMCLFVPVVSYRRYHGDPYALVGVCAVLAFPCVAMLISWSVLIVTFTGHWPGNLDYAPGAHVLAFPDGVAGGIWPAVRSALAGVGRSVAYLTAALLVAFRARRPLQALALILPVLGLAIMIWLGFAYNQVAAFYLFALLTVSVVEYHELLDRRVDWAILLTVAVLQVGVAIVWTPLSVGYVHWLHLLFPPWAQRMFGPGLP